MGAPVSGSAPDSGPLADGPPPGASEVLSVPPVDGASLVCPDVSVVVVGAVEVGWVGVGSFGVVVVGVGVGCSSQSIVPAKR